MTTDDTVRGMLLRGALAANGVESITWPDGSRDYFNEGWQELAEPVKEHWASLARVVFSCTNSLP